MKETNIFSSKPKHEKPKTVHTHENIAAVAESVCEAPSTSIYRRSQQLNTSETSLRRILHKDLCMTPYKVQVVQELKPIDHQMRFLLSVSGPAIDLQKILAKKIIFPDEVDFGSKGTDLEYFLEVRQQISFCGKS